MPSQRLVAISQDNGLTWTTTKGKGIWVIVPGAGTIQNKETYLQLESKMIKVGGKWKDQEIEYFDTKTRAGGFVYPPKWGDINKVEMPRKKENTLAGLAAQMKKRLKKGPPAMIICGSRGGQVVLPLLLKNCWRGAFIAINAGPLMTKSVFHHPCRPFFVTCGKDYFRTKDPELVREIFEKSSHVDGINIFIPEFGHMPDLTQTYWGTELLIPNICDAILERDIRNRNRLFRDHRGHDWYIVHRMKGHLSDDPNPPCTPLYTIKSHKGMKIIYLRENHFADSFFKNRKERSVINGDKVKILHRATDDEGFSMVYVEPEKSTLGGWIYEINIKEFN